MGYFPDFAQTSRLGFQAGAEMGQGQNPLGTFIRSMLADWQQRRAMGQEYGMKKDLIQEEAKARQQYPTPWEAYMAKQLEGEENKGITTAENVKTEFLSQNPQYQESDILLKPQYTTYKGTTRQTGFIPELNQKAYEERIKKEEKGRFVKESAQDALNSILEVEKGINKFGLTGQLPSFPGTPRATWEANVNKLLSGKIIDVMTQMKEASKTGATGFGQLSNKELSVLRESSTALKRWLPPQDAQKILNDMKIKLNKIVEVEPQKFSPDQERIIQDNIHHYGKSREEIINALRQRGYL